MHKIFKRVNFMLVHLTSEDEDVDLKGGQLRGYYVLF